MIFSGKVYDVLKWIAQVVLPALGTLYFTIDELMHWDHGALISGIVLAVDAFLGVILGLSSNQYNKQVRDNAPDGDLIVSETDGEKYFGLGISKDAFEGIADKTTVRLNVVKNTPSG
jgi:hypothetical protein